MKAICPGVIARSFRPTKHMKILPLLLAIGVLALFSSTGRALTIDQAVTPAYVRENPRKFSVKVNKEQNGLLAFTVIRTLAEPKYLVAHLAVHHQGRIIAESHTPFFGRKNDNIFRFSISPEHVPDSTFEIGESSFTDGVPLPGTVNYQFRIKDFVPADLLK
jgi:hypothetical protein